MSITVIQGNTLKAGVLNRFVGDVRIEGDVSSDIIIEVDGCVIVTGDIGYSSKITASKSCTVGGELYTDSTIEAADITIKGLSNYRCTLTSTAGDVSINGAYDDLTVHAAGAFHNSGDLGEDAKIAVHQDPLLLQRRAWAEKIAAAAANAKAHGTGFGWELIR